MTTTSPVRDPPPNAKECHHIDRTAQADFFASPAGTRIVVPQLRQRTVRPRADIGTASMLRHFRFGHMIRIVLGFLLSMAGSTPFHDPEIHRRSADIA